MIPFRYILALILLMGNLASTPLLGQDVTETTLTAESQSDLLNITYTDTDTGLKIKFSGITFAHIVDFTLNGDIVTDAITALIFEEEENVITVIRNDTGFELDVALPMYLLQEQEFGVILDNGLKVSSVIMLDDDKSLIFFTQQTYVQLLQSLGFIFGW